MLLAQVLWAKTATYDGQKTVAIEIFFHYCMEQLARAYIRYVTRYHGMPHAIVFLSRYEIFVTILEITSTGDGDHTSS